jgi:hypothetical protein
MQSRNCLLNESENYCIIKHLLELKVRGAKPRAKKKIAKWLVIMEHF